MEQEAVGPLQSTPEVENQDEQAQNVELDVAPIAPEAKEAQPPVGREEAALVEVDFNGKQLG